MKKSVKGIFIILVAIFILTACTTAPAAKQETASPETNTATADASSTNTASESTQKSTSTPEATKTSTIKINIQNFAFSPAEITIKAGDTIDWENKDSAPHTVTSDTGSELSSQTLKNGDTFSHTFTSPGVYDYHCTIHPSMTAKVIVQ
ncbi:cupredoxin family copper-binding protein [Candidatus Woesearchaeota archaeon]|nr:cupredoxin family copper-binding protein [Candidatus Woesearchaeota archaeon]